MCYRCSVYTVFGDSISGNCYKIRLLLTQLKIPFAWTEVSVVDGDTRTPEFLARNPNGRVPILEYAEGEYLAESNAILCYLADGTSFYPSERLSRAKILEWMFFEQYSHEPYIATSRYIIRYLGRPEHMEKSLLEKQPGGYRALDVLERTLNRSDYLVAGAYSIADIALYAYTHVAHEGGFSLTDYPQIQAWLARVSAQPGYIGMPGDLEH